jgi:membrane-associated phospholipid phosphatase
MVHLQEDLFSREAYRHFRLAAAFSLLLACIAGLFIYFQGKQNSFLLINHFHSSPFDTFFEYYTFLGDGLVWVPLLFYVIARKRSFIIPVLLAFVICTLLTQFSKWVIYADALRPLAELKEQVRTITGVDVHSTSSFPSGHTSSAFTFALMLAFLVKRNFSSFFFPVAAFFVGYSRVYLAQHFVTDVFAGIIVGLASAFLALVFHARYLRYKTARA